MKHQLIGILATILLIINSSCEKQIPTVLTGHFYTTDSSTGDNDIKLWIDGIDKGYLPFINQAFTDSLQIDSTLLQQTLAVSFMSGTHQIQAIKTNGTVIASSKMYFEFYKNKTKSGVQSDIGAAGHILQNNPKRLVIWLSHTIK